MPLAKQLPAKDDASYDLIFLKGKALGFITIYVKYISFIISRITKVQRNFGIPSKHPLKK